MPELTSATAPATPATPTPDSGAIPPSSGAAPRNPDGTFAPAAFDPSTQRYGSDWHIEWQRGKTIKEVADLGNQMYAELVRRQPAPVTAPSQNLTPMSGGATPQPPSQELWLTDPQRAAAEQTAYVRATQFEPAFNEMASQTGQMAREVVRMRYPKEFGKWGPEIDLYIQQMDPRQRTVDMLEKVIGLVRGNHIDEIARERVDEEIQRRMESGAILRPGAAPTGASTPQPGGQIDFDKAGLPPNYRAVLARYNITPDVLDSFLMKTEVMATGCTLPEARERWLKRASKGDIITEAANANIVNLNGGAR